MHIPKMCAYFHFHCHIKSCITWSRQWCPTWLLCFHGAPLQYTISSKKNDYVTALLKTFNGFPLYLDTIYNPSVASKVICNLVLATHWLSFRSLTIPNFFPTCQDFVHMVAPHPPLSCRFLLKYLFSSSRLQYSLLLKSLIAPNFQ